MGHPRVPYDRYTVLYGLIELILSIIIAVVGIMLELNPVGSTFSRPDQALFAHSVLGYGLVLFICGGVLPLFLVTTLYGFILTGLLNLLLGLASAAVGAAVMVKPDAILRHGYIALYLGSIKSINFIIGGIAIAHGLWVLLFAALVWVYHAKVFPSFNTLKTTLTKAAQTGNRFA